MDSCPRAGGAFDHVVEYRCNRSSRSPLVHGALAVFRSHDEDGQLRRKRPESLIQALC